MNRDRLPSIELESGYKYRGVTNLGIAQRIAGRIRARREEKEEIYYNEEDEMRLQRLGFNEEYFNNR